MPDAPDIPVSALLAPTLLAAMYGFSVNLLRARREKKLSSEGEAFGVRPDAASASAGWVAVFAVAMTLAGVTATLLSFLRQGGHPHREQALFSFASVGADTLPVRLATDSLGLTFALVTCSVGLCIFVYSVAYMRGERARARFFGWLSLFVFCMLLLVFADHWLAFFIGWEGIGLCSYGLIGFHWREGHRPAAAMTAFVTNRVGDAALLLAIGLLFLGSQGSWVDLSPSHTTSTLRALAPEGATTFVLLCLLAASGKSAQGFLFFWLPGAMAGPTPVSALIHAATLVTAGVYLLVRAAPVIALTPSAGEIIAWVGGVTALGAALAACRQWDIKRVLAYSTISQMGLTFVALGSGHPEAATFHVVTHACFKACLFLAAGSVISSVHGPFETESAAQDMRNLGGLKAALPRTERAYRVACMAISAVPIPGLSGFWSKEEILVGLVRGSSVTPSSSDALFVVSLAVSGLTSFYIWRTHTRVFLGEPKPSLTGAHEPSALMLVPVYVLAAASALVGALLAWPNAFGGERLSPLDAWLGVVTSHASSRVSPVFVTAMSVGVAFVGFFAARMGAHRRAQTERAHLPRLTLEGVIAHFIVRPARALSLATLSVERDVIDALSTLASASTKIASFFVTFADDALVDKAVRGLAGASYRAGHRLRAFQTGRVQTYVYPIAGGLACMVILAYVCMRNLRP